MTGLRLEIHLWLYRRSTPYRWAWNWHVTWGLHRLQGYGRFEALVSILAHRVCGHRMFWYPRAKREAMRVERDVMPDHPWSPGIDGAA